MQSQIHNQPLSMSIVSNRSQAWQQLLPQNMQNSISSPGVQNSAGLTSTLPAVGNLTQASMPDVVGQNSLQNMQNISNVAQNPVGNSLGQGMPSNVFANSQRQMARRQQVVPQQQQQQSASSQLLYQQQLQQQYMKQKFQQGSIQQSLMQSNLQEHQQQQNLLQPSQIQTFQQAVMQLSVMQSLLSNLQQHQLSSVQQGSQLLLQQHSQSVTKQQQQPQQESILYQQQTSMPQQQMLPTPQQGQQQLIGQQPNAKNIQQNQLIGQPNGIPDLQPQKQRLMGQQNNISNLQQQQLMGQQNNLSNMLQPQLEINDTTISEIGLDLQLSLGPLTNGIQSYSEVQSNSLSSVQEMSLDMHLDPLIPFGYAFGSFDPIFSSRNELSLDPRSEAEDDSTSSSSIKNYRHRSSSPNTSKFISNSDSNFTDLNAFAQLLRGG